MILLFRLLSRLPRSVLHRLGAALGWLVSAALADLSPSPAREHGAGAWRGRSAPCARRSSPIAGVRRSSRPSIWLRPLEETAARVVKVSGGRACRRGAARRPGHPGITPHLGCFEVTAQYLSTQAPIVVLYRPAQAGLVAGDDRGRRARVRNCASRRPTSVAFARCSRRCGGEAAGMLPDQAPQAGEGALVDFFGKPAYTMTGAGGASHRDRRHGAHGLGRTLARRRRLSLSSAAADPGFERRHRTARAADQRRDRALDPAVPAAVSLGL